MSAQIEIPTAEFTLPDVQTFEEAAEAMRDLQEEAGARIDAIRLKGRELIILRFMQGVVAKRAMDMPGDEKYGKGVIRHLAKRAGMHQRTLYNAVQFVKALPFGNSVIRLQQWMAMKEDEKSKPINWTYCRNWARKELSQEAESESEKLTRQRNDLNEKADQIEQKAKELEKEAEALAQEHQNGTVPPEVQEAQGVTAIVNQRVQDLRRQTNGVQTDERIVIEEYLDHVRGYPCFLCGEPQTDAHHIEAGGTGTKGSDTHTIPLCRKCHNEVHQEGARYIEQQYERDAWKFVAYLQTEFMTGARLIPSYARK